MKSSHSISPHVVSLHVWIVVAIAIGGCGPQFFDSRVEFTGLTGKSAKKRLTHAWPESVAANAVDAMNYKFQSSRDSSSKWCCIKLKRTEAAAWRDFVHSQEEDWARILAKMHDGKYYEPEGVHRMIAGPPPLRRQTGTTPVWWSPPSIEFRATEVVVWYAATDGGTSRAEYSAYDESNSTLWIYGYTCQHDLLWSRGSRPEGQPIELSNRDETDN